MAAAGVFPPVTAAAAATSSRKTPHREHALEDCAQLRQLGVGVAREGVPWSLVDRGDRYDFRAIDPFTDATNAMQVLPTSDLCHGYPDDADPFRAGFVGRFARYCRAAAGYIVPRVHGPHFFTPVSGITFWGFCGGEGGWAAPFGGDAPPAGASTRCCAKRRLRA